MAFVNRSQYIAVTGNFALISRSGHGFRLHELFQTIIGGIDALNPVGSLRALDSRNVQQLRQRIRLCFNEEILLALIFMDL